jgi:hypothetical protein
MHSWILNIQQENSRQNPERFPRHIELYFAGLYAEYLVDSLSLAELRVIRPEPMRLTE